MTNSNDGKKPFGEKAKEVAGVASQEAKTRAQDVADTVATEAGHQAAQAKDAAADEVKNVSSALRTAADEMRSGSAQERTFSQIADGLADASESMRDKDLGELVGAVTDFAKRNPAVFLGSAALIGFAATRFAKASSENATRSATYSRHEDQMDPPVPSTRTRDSGMSGNQNPAMSDTQEGSKI